MPKVSVIIPVYNDQKFLNECISSVANQTMEDIEIIAVNDGSTDNSLSILDKLSSKYKGKLKVYTKENGGAGSARNIGLENANGEFIKFVDADDYLDANVLEKMYTIAKENNVSLVRGNYRYVYGPIKLDKPGWTGVTGNKIVDVRKYKDYITAEAPNVGNKLMSRELIGDLRFPEKTKWEDIAFIPVVIASSEKLFYMDETVYNYRINMNTTANDLINKIPSILDIIKCVENIEHEMEVRGLSEEYSEQIKSMYILHTLLRIKNAMFWVNFPHKKKEVVISSLLAILDAKYPDWEDNKMVESYKNSSRLFDFTMNRLNSYTNYDYRSVDRETAENNIRNSFK